MRVLVVSDDGISSYVENIDADDLSRFREILKCYTVDVVTRRINHHDYAVFVDDCGLLVRKPVTAISEGMNGWKTALVGTLVIAGLDEDGDCIDMTDGDIWTVMDRFAKINDGEEMRRVVVLG